MPSWAALRTQHLADFPTSAQIRSKSGMFFGVFLAANHVRVSRSAAELLTRCTGQSKDILGDHFATLWTAIESAGTNWLSWFLGGYGIGQDKGQGGGEKNRGFHDDG